MIFLAQLNQMKVGATAIIMVFFMLAWYRQETVLGDKTQILNIENQQLPIRTTDKKIPRFAAKNVMIIDNNSGKVLVNQNAFAKVPIASIAKVMTAIVAFEHYRLNDVITVSKNASTINGSRINLRMDEQITVESLIYGLLVQSGNDAAEALAEYIGSRNVFLQLMNHQAQAIGTTNTYFADPSGLSNETVATAYDVGLIMKYALRYPKLIEIAQTPKTTIYSVDGQLKHELENSNRLVKEEMYYPGIKVGKTGFTPDAGHNLASVVEKDQQQLISVVINTDSSNNSASAEVTRQVFDWVFNNYQWIEL